MEGKQIYKKTKLFFSIVKEKIWLEEMAQKGYLLTNIKNGIRYTFEISEPKHMIYEVDRFYLPKSPSLKEIYQKDEFISLAAQMGWSVVTHDEDMNYYFAKEYVEGDINELYDNEEMRLVRANKYRNRYLSYNMSFDIWGFVFGLVMLVLGIFEKQFIALGLGYVLCILAINIIMRYSANFMYNDLRVTTEEWKYQHLKDTNTFTVHKWFLFSKGLSNYLRKQSEKGWKINSINSSKYVFKKSDPQHITYVIDTKEAVNRRMKEKKQQEFIDKKDTLLQNNDWQIQSIKDANEKGLVFICASGNNIVVYANNNSTVDQNYAKNTCINPIILFYLTCVLVGALLGFVSGYLYLAVF